MWTDYVVNVYCVKLQGKWNKNIPLCLLALLLMSLPVLQRSSYHFLTSLPNSKPICPVTLHHLLPFLQSHLQLSSQKNPLATFHFPFPMLSNVLYLQRQWKVTMGMVAEQAGTTNKDRKRHNYRVKQLVFICEPPWLFIWLLPSSSPSPPPPPPSIHTHTHTRVCIIDIFVNARPPEKPRSCHSNIVM